jgi:hypothetical protein
MGKSMVLGGRSIAGRGERRASRSQPLLSSLTLLCVFSLGLVLAPEAWAEESSSSYDKAGVTHNEQCIKTTGNKSVVVRDVEGNQLQTNGGAVTDPTEQKETCSGGAGIRFQGIESVSAKGLAMYYTWPFEGGKQSHGFVWVSELASRPAVNGAAAAGNGAAAPPASGEPAYTITPEDIAPEQRYKGPSTGLWYLYSVYGRPLAGAKFALMAWSWIDVAGGGIGRAAVAQGERFYPANVQPISLQSKSGESQPANGTVTARYGYVNNGTGKVYGWMVTSHTFNGVCHNHMVYFGGGPALSSTLCPPGPRASNAWALSRPNEELDAFFVGMNNVMYDWFAHPGWTLAELRPELGYQSAAGYPSAFVRANGDLAAYFRGGNNDIYQLYANTQWHAEALGCCSAGDPLAFERSNGEIQVFFRGTNNGIYNVWYSAGHWNPPQRLGGGSEMLGKPSGFERSNGEIQVFFRGTDNGIYNLWYNGGQWQVEKLGCCTAGNPAALERSNGEIDVFFRGTNNSIYDIWYSGGVWNQPAELATEAAGNPSAFERANGEIQLFYRARQTGAIWNGWAARGAQGWSFQERACCAAGGPSAFEQPSGALRVFFRGTDNAIYDFPYAGGTWYPPEKLGGVGAAAEDPEY